MIILFEGPDNSGKSTQIQKLLPLLHDKPTHQLHYSAVKGFSTSEESLAYSYELYRTMFQLFYSNYKELNFTSDRSHLGELVYGPLYRNYSAGYVLDLEKYWMNQKEFWNIVYLITFIDLPENLIKRDDGLSFSVEVDKKKKEIGMFKTAHSLSKISNKLLIDVNNSSIENVHNKIINFLFN